MAAYRRVNGKSPACWLPVHRDQFRAQRSVRIMGKLYLYLYSVHRRTVRLKLHWFNLLICCTTNPQQIDPMEYEPCGSSTVCRLIVKIWAATRHAVGKDYLSWVWVWAPKPPPQYGAGLTYFNQIWHFLHFAVKSLVLADYWVYSGEGDSQ